MNLYELVAEFRATAAQLADLDLPDAVISDTLEGAAYPIEVKSRNCVAVAQNLQAEADLIAARIDTLKMRQKSLERRAQWLHDYVLGAMQALGITEIRCADFVAKPRQNPPSVVIDNEAGLPDSCWRVIPEHREPDKPAIKAALEAGDERVSSAAHLERKWKLSVR